ncbi:MAG: hypothetical protein K2H34_09945, partial [Lachnospiraceae bacterium]|nr:hypothetical protein [Lachnospiraceae bacterium]
IGGPTGLPNRLVNWVGSPGTKHDYSYQADKYFPNLEQDDNWELVGDSDEHTYFDLEYYFHKYENKNPKPLS